MAATVTVRGHAFSDSRIAFLAQLLGCTWSDAFVRAVRVWGLCAERQTDRPEVRMIRACLEHGEGERHLVESGLADDSRRDPALGDSVVRVRGCNETDWYLAQLEQRAQSEAGRIRAAIAQRDTRGRFVPERPDRPPDGPPDDQPAPASDHSPDLISDLVPDLISDLPAYKLPDPDPRTIVRARIPAVGGARLEQRRRLFGDAWAYAGLKHKELKRQEIDPHARNCWVAMPDASSLEARSLFARIDEIAAGDAPDWARARELVRNRVDVAAAEARRDCTLRWFTPARMWDEKSFAIAKDLSPEQAAQPRRPNPPPVGGEPTRRIKDL